MTGREGSVRFVVGALMLAAAGLAAAIVLLAPGSGSNSAAVGIGAGAVPRVLFTQDEEPAPAPAPEAIADGFDRDEGRAVLGQGKEDEDQSLHGLAHKAHGHYRRHMRAHAARYAFMFVFQTTVMFGVAWILKQYGPAHLPQEAEPEQDPEVGRTVFAYGLLDEKECWSEDLLLCILSWCCTGIQWANNVSKPKISVVSSFWVALMLSALNSYELNALTHGVSFMVWVVIAVYARQKLRDKYGLESGSMITLAQDIFVWCCCCRCAAAQEARQIAHVRTPDVRDAQFGEATQLQVDEDLPSSRRTLLRPNEEGAGRENTANTDLSDL